MTQEKEKEKEKEKANGAPLPSKFSGLASAKRVG
jgi:hypothetical protein